MVVLRRRGSDDTRTVCLSVARGAVLIESLIFHLDHHTEEFIYFIMCTLEGVSVCVSRVCIMWSGSAMCDGIARKTLKMDVKSLRFQDEVGGRLHLRTMGKGLVK